MKSKLAIASLALLPLAGQYAMAAEEAAPEAPIACPEVAPVTCPEAAVEAEEAPVEVSPFEVSAELGFLYKTGNAKSGDIKAALNVKHEEGQWLSLLAINAIAKKLEQTDEETGNESFETTDNKWNVAGQTNYSLEEDGKNYLYGSVFYEQDRFSGFASQSSASVGWGRQWWDDETSTFFADIGPGIKYDVIAYDPHAIPVIEEEGDTAAIIQAQALYKSNINEHVEFEQYLVAKQAVESDKNSIYKSVTSLSTKLIDSLQFKFSFTVDYDTEVEEEFENLNTETSVTLIYSF